MQVLVLVLGPAMMLVLGINSSVLGGIQQS